MMKRILAAIGLCILLTGVMQANAQNTRDRRVPTPEIPASVLSLDGSDWALSFWKQGKTLAGNASLSGTAAPARSDTAKQLEEVVLY